MIQRNQYTLREWARQAIATYRAGREGRKRAAEREQSRASTNAILFLPFTAADVCWLRAIRINPWQ